MKKHVGLSSLLIVCLLMLISLQPALAQDDSFIVEGRIDDTSNWVSTPLTVAAEQAGKSLVIDLAPTSGDLDTLLYLVDSNNNIIEVNDDRSGNDLSSLIIFPRIFEGDYQIISTRFNIETGTTSGDFILNVSYAETNPPPPAYRVSDADLAEAGFPILEPRPLAEWTILSYYGGDTNLEPDIIRDFKEFERAGGSNETVRVVAFLDRHPEFWNGSGGWASARIFEITEDVSGEPESGDPPAIDSEPLADLGVKDSGDGELFAQFLAWSVKTYPARNYVLTFASHGAGWAGVISDDTDGANILTLPELEQALSIGLELADVDRFQLLINDACLMSSIEYHDVMARYFELSIASPEIVVNPALDMTLFVDLLNENPQVALANLGEALIDKYIDEDILLRPGRDNVYLSSAMTNLTEFDRVTTAIENFAQIVIDNPQVHSTAIGKARSNVYTYTAFLGQNELVDLGSLMQSVIQASTDPPLQAAAEAVLDALRETIAYERAGERASQATDTYHNIYFPVDSASFNLGYFSQTPLVNWATMLRTYYNIVTPQSWAASEEDEVAFHPPVPPTISVTRIFPENGFSSRFPLSTSLEIVGRNIAYVDTTADQIQPDGSKLRVFSQRLLNPVIIDGVLYRQNNWLSAGTNNRDTSWDGTVPYVSDGTNTNSEAVFLSEDLVSLDGEYQEPGSATWNQVTIAFDYDGAFQRSVNRSEGTDALGVITIPVGSVFRTFSQLVTPDGRIVLQPGNEYVWPESGLTWRYQPAETGQYDVGLLVTSFSGATGFDSLTTLIDNDNVDRSLRAHIWPQLGFVLSRPEEWQELALVPEENLLRSDDREGRGNYTVYVAIGTPDDLQAIAESVILNYGLQSNRIFTPIVVDGVPALEFDYGYQNDTGAYTGRGFATYNPVSGFGFVFGAATLDNIFNVDTIYSLMRDNMIFFDISQTGFDDRTWQLNREIADVVYPMPISWAAAGASESWNSFSPASGPGTFAAVQEILSFNPDEDTRLSMLESLLQSDVAVGASDFEPEAEPRTYNGENGIWDSFTYRAQRDGQAVVGRLYTSIFSIPDEAGQVTQRAFAVWVESPADDDLAATFESILEIIVDGFRIRGS